MAPFDLWTLFGSVGGFLAYLTLGFLFGFVLEAAGFSDARKLAGQFYFKDLSVVRVMFTAIVTSMLLVFLCSTLGLMDFQDVWVNPTYMVSGVVGGLVMGVGFIVGGYCPGTSIAAAATGKIDAMLFVGGALTGMLVFGEVADDMAGFMDLTNWGRLTLMDTFGLSVGWVVVGVLLLAITFFVVMDQLKRAIWADDERGAFAVGGRPVQAWVLLLPAFAIAAVIGARGMPTVDETWALRAEEYQARLDERAVYIDPAELATYLHDDDVELRIVDVRDESSFNLFHLRDARHHDLDELDRIWTLAEKGNRLVVVVSNDEAAATTAWKRMTAMKVPNVYILDGGMNHWLDRYGRAAVVSSLPADARPGDDTLCHTFAQAIGDRHPGSRPSRREIAQDLEGRPYETKVELEVKARKGGGCG